MKPGCYLLFLYSFEAFPLFTDGDIATNDNSVDVAIPVVLTLLFTLMSMSARKLTTNVHINTTLY